MAIVRHIDLGRALLLLVSAVICPVSSGQNKAKPLTDSEVIGLLRNYVPPATVAELAREKGIDFTLSPDDEKQLRRAGASAALIETLKDLAPVGTERPDRAVYITHCRQCHGTNGEGNAAIAKMLHITMRPLGSSDVRDKNDAVLTKDITRGVGQMKPVKLTYAQVRDVIAYIRALSVEATSAESAVNSFPVDHARSVVYVKRKVNPKDWLTYVWIPPGRFTMGCSGGDAECYGDEQPAHEVTITKGFWLGQTPVTQVAYQRVTGSNPSAFRGDNLPVEQVTWDEARSYCQAIDGRLPTEAEWEYAARAGTTGSLYGSLDDIAWYSENSGGGTHEAGRKQPNDFGLYDMLGNVKQWTADRYGEAYYQASPRRDPTGPPSGQGRVLRGGAWDLDPRYIHVWYRGGFKPGVRFYNLGLRCGAE
jgi:formylglycine-generating enzyme required for sulfatase activity